jgi:ribonuclease J
VKPNNQPNQQRPSAKNRHEAVRASLRNLERAREASGMNDTDRPVNRSAFSGSKPANTSRFSAAPTLKVIPLGGLGEVGRNMNVIEYGNDAIIVDAGLRLGIDLPGINYAIPELTYLDKIKTKIRGHVFTHGHLDHVGAMPFVLSNYPAPCYGSRFTLDMLERIMLDRDPDTRLDKRYLNPDSHEKIAIGPFKIEIVRVTHSIPDACAVVIETPVGKIVHTGDFKFDPKPLDGKLADLDRLRVIGEEGALLLMSDSTNCEALGRTPSESLIEPTIDMLIKNAPGRIIISAVSTNINRIQMIINAATKEHRKVAIDGRSMLANVELAVRNGYMKIPRGTILAMRDIGRVPDKQLAIVSTGHQGELGSVLMRMASGEHKFVKLKSSDTIIMSSSIIPGNEQAVIGVVDRLLREGAIVFRHTTRDLDGTGILHVSGHANRDELTEMIGMVKPKYFMPIHGEFHHQVRHAELAVHAGIPKANVFVLDNGDVFEVNNASASKTGRVPAGTQLVDQTGEIVPNLVIQDRLLMSQDGIVVVVLTLDRKNGAVLSSPDIIRRGFVYLKEAEDLMNDLRGELRGFSSRRFGKVEINRFKQELRDHINGFLFQRTARSPIIIPVINVIGADDKKRQTPSPTPPPISTSQGPVYPI